MGSVFGIGWVVAGLLAVLVVRPQLFRVWMLPDKESGFAGPIAHALAEKPGCMDATVRILAGAFALLIVHSLMK